MRLALLWINGHRMLQKTYQTGRLSRQNTPGLSVLSLIQGSEKQISHSVCYISAQKSTVSWVLCVRNKIKLRCN